MICLIQRVGHGRVLVGNEVVGAIDAGLLALVGLEPGDGDAQVARMAERLLGYRVFADDEGRMNRSLADAGLRLLTLRSAGFNHVDLRVAEERGVLVARVPAYSPRS